MKINKTRQFKIYKIKNKISNKEQILVNKILKTVDGITKIYCIQQTNGLWKCWNDTADRIFVGRNKIAVLKRVLRKYTKIRKQLVICGIVNN